MYEIEEDHQGATHSDSTLQHIERAEPHDEWSSSGPCRENPEAL